MARMKLLPRRRNLAPRLHQCRLRCVLLALQFLPRRLRDLQSQVLSLLRRDQQLLRVPRSRRRVLPRAAEFLEPRRLVL